MMDGYTALPNDGSKHPAIAEKIRARVLIDANGCHVWQGHKRNGYGVFNFTNGEKRAHRIAYELARGPIPNGLVLDHLCRNRACVNAEHLEPVTLIENIQRGEGGLHMKRKALESTHCKHGHPRTAENTYWVPGRTNTRQCRICCNARTREWWARLRKGSTV